MNSIWLSLLWKEWREQCWKLAALTGIVTATMAVLNWIIRANASVQSVLVLLGISSVVLLVYTILTGAFMGMSVAGRENSRQTMRFLQSLPIPMWQAACAKLVVAIFTVTVPIVVLTGVTWLLANFVLGDPQTFAVAADEDLRQIGRPWEISNWFAARTMPSILAVASILLWMMAGGVNRSDEVRAGAIGFLLVAGVWLAFACAVTVVDGYSLPELKTVLLALVPALPGGGGVSARSMFRSVEMMFPIMAVVGILGHAAVLAWYLKHFGRVSVPLKHTATTPWWRWSRSQSVGLPLQTQLVAIAWKQVRETGPLALLAVVGILTLVPLVYWLNRRVGGGAELGEMLVGVSIGVAMLVTMVTGIGVLLEDYEPKVNNFWRSRPVNPHAWFAVKYTTGLIVLAVTFGPLLLLAHRATGWRYGTVNEMLTLTFVFVAVYTLSLTAYALVRQPIYAVVLGMGSLLPVSLVDSWLGHDLPLWQSWMIFLSAFASVVVLAWQAVVRDWGWKQGR